MSADDRQQRIDTLRAALKDIRAVKHQMCNELMGVLGHAELLGDQPELSEKSRLRVARIRQHCDNLNKQAEELTRICIGESTTD